MIFHVTLRGQTPLLSGGNFAGKISQPGEIQEWVFEAQKDNFIALSIGEVFEGEVDPGFVPWIRLIGPDGNQIGNNWGQLVGQISVRAPLSGAYTVRVGSNDSGNDATGSYLLHFALIPTDASVPDGDEGGALSNGGNHPGKIHLGDLDIWWFDAKKDDSIGLSIGEIFASEADPGFVPWIRLYGPDGTQLGNNWGPLVGQITESAPLTGKYTVLVGSNDSGNDATGSYLLHLALIPGTYVIPEGDDGGALTNGANHPGRIHLGDLDIWWFDAAKDDSIRLSIGEVFESEVDPGYVPWIRLYGPDGAQLGNSWGQLVGQISQTAPLTGTYTVLVGSNDSGNDATGNYLLRLALMPETVVVPQGDEGGALTNGGNHAGTIELGDLDIWSFEAQKDDAIHLSIGEVFESEVDPGFVPWIRLFSPDGAQIGNNWGQLVGQINNTAPLSGTYTLVVGSNDAGNDAAGKYLLHLALMPEQFIVPTGDQGGHVPESGVAQGEIPPGDLDLWTFGAHALSQVQIRLKELTGDNFVPWLRLYGADGALLRNTWNANEAQTTFALPVSGLYSVVVASNDAGNDGSGTYSLEITGFPTGARELRYMRAQNNTFSVTWPAELSEYVLQSNTQLVNDGWVDVDIAPEDNGFNRRLLLPMEPETRFFRLVPR